MEDFKRKKAINDKKINGSLIRWRKKAKKRTRKKQKGKENLKKSIGISLVSHNFKPGKEKNPERLDIKVRQGMESMFFKGLRSDYITRKALGEANEARKNEDINTIIDIGKVLLQRGRHLGRSLKRFYDGGTDEREPEKSAKISSEGIGDLERCPLSPISGVTLTFVENQFSSTLRTSKRNKLDVEKEFEIFSRKYEEVVADEVLLRLPRSGVLEDALNAVRKRQKTGQTYPGSVSEEFQGDETQFSKEFKFSAEDFEPEKPAAEDFIKNFIFSDNLLVPKTDYFERFTGKNLREELLMLGEEESENYNRLSSQPVFGSNEDDNSLSVFVSQGKNLESSTKDLSITTPPIQFYRRNMF